MVAWSRLTVYQHEVILVERIADKFVYRQAHVHENSGLCFVSRFAQSDSGTGKGGTV